MLSKAIIILIKSIEKTKQAIVDNQGLIDMMEKAKTEKNKIDQDIYVVFHPDPTKTPRNKKRPPKLF